MSVRIPQHHGRLAAPANDIYELQVCRCCELPVHVVAEPSLIEHKLLAECNNPECEFSGFLSALKVKTARVHIRFQRTTSRSC